MRRKTSPRVFATGASGHVGGSAALRDEGRAFTGLVRSAERVAYLQERGIAAILGSRNDVETLANATGEADAVITTAEADNSELVTTLISVLEGTGKGLILMSGSSVVADDAQSAFASDKIYGDDVPCVSPPSRRERVAVDVMVRNAGITGAIQGAVT